jgi:hypothetical protein
MPSPDCAALTLAGDHAKYELRDSNGKTHNATLVRIERANALLRSNGQVIVVPCNELARHEHPADRRWDGALIGFGAGLGMAVLVGAGSATGSLMNDSPDAHYSEPKGTEIAVIAASTAIGFAIDSLHGGKKTVFVGTLPSTATPASGLTLGVTGHTHQRMLRVGYHVTF